MKTKTCTKCQQEKPLEEFWKNKQQTDGHHTFCKVCGRFAQNKKYNENEDLRLCKRAYQKALRKETRIKILSFLKRKGCADCGNSDPLVLELDHTRDKKDDVSQMVAHNKTWNDIEAEIAKCEVRCANCHRKKTARDQNWYADIDLDSL